MLRLTFTEEQRQILSRERFQHPHPRVRKKFEVVWLKSQGLRHDEIARLADISNKTLRSYLKEYAEGGFAGLSRISFHRPQSRLAAHQDTIITEFQVHPPATINEARHRIEQLTGLKRSPTAIRTFLKRCKLKRRKTGVLPAKVNPEIQEEFKRNTWSPD